MNFSSSSSASLTPARSGWFTWLWLLCLLTSPLFLSEVEAKRRTVPSHPPELRILNVTAEPTPYSPTVGTLQLTVEVELPANLALNTILEVSSLISSPSKRSMRFLVNRQPIDPSTLSGGSSTSGAAEDKPRLEVTLVWDGTDQTKQFVSEGRYNYEVRAKLLLAGEDGPPRTHMVSWKKLGAVTVEGR